MGKWMWNLWKIGLLSLALLNSAFASRQMENLDRGLVAIKVSDGVYLSWRMLGTDPSAIGFNVYRDSVLVNSSPITASTNLTDTSGASSSTYSVRPVVNDTEYVADDTVSVLSNPWISIPLDRPDGGTLHDTAYTYSPNDASTGDLDGDGKWDIVLKWDPSDSKDNSKSGYTADVYLDGYTLTGTRLWRIDLGPNIRAGAHYTQFLVADFDGDGKAEVMCKTAPGTKDGTGAYLSKGPAASDTNTAVYRNSSGYILSGPEYLTVFSGATGAELATVEYVPTRGTVDDWGDSYGNRVDRFLATIAYLDGTKPSAVFQRGYYTRMAITAWDWDGSNLTQRWYYNAATSGKECYGQGNHNLAAGDVDGDGYDEMIEGSCAVDHDGAFMYRTGLGHGDAMHLGDLLPSRDGLEVWEVHEDSSASIQYSHELHDAATGEIIWGTADANGGDNGRGLAADIDSGYAGYEMWSTLAGTYSATGSQISSSTPTDNTTAQYNFRVYWDGDLYDELLTGTTMSKWTGTGLTRMYPYGGTKQFYQYPNTSDYATSNNGTKATPALLADLIGDWREEVVYGTSNADSLIIFTTTTATTHRMYTLMHDPVYRNAISWQNTAYNQPPHLSFLLSDTANWPTPDIILVGASSWVPSNTDCSGVVDGSASTDDCGRCVGGTTGLTACAGAIQGENFCEADGVEENSNSGYLGEGYLNFTNAVGSAATYGVNSGAAQTVTFYFRYANGGTSARPLSLQMNGTTIEDSVVFESTSTWTTWAILSVDVALGAGQNVLGLTSLTADGGPNFDLIGFSAENVDSSGCGTTASQFLPQTSVRVSGHFHGASLSLTRNPGADQIRFRGVSGKTWEVLGIQGMDVNCGDLPPGVYLIQLLRSGKPLSSFIAVKAKPQGW
ncbi:MAG TPA: carbohydrate-binding protein [Fibrobacteraceae bacterium]|nr:carbohydrate-binding protein [Fibrobacteraceae bacterium]